MMNSSSSSSSSSSYSSYSQQERLLPLLPDETSIGCIARVQRVFHPNLTLVSRSWRSLLKSSLFYVVRSELDCTQNFICFNIDRTMPPLGSEWYIIDHPDGIRNPPPPPSDRFLSLLPPSPIPTIGSACASVGPRIFVLGGNILSDTSPSTYVQIFDARFNHWYMGPPMLVPRDYATASVVNGKVYVLGGCSPLVIGWAEVFDPELATWAPMPDPDNIRDKLPKSHYRSTVLDGAKILAVCPEPCGGGVVFDTQLSSWDSLSKVLWRDRAIMTGVDEIIYSYDCNIIWYDWTKDRWEHVEGLERKELPRFLSSPFLANVGDDDRIYVLWRRMMTRNNKREWDIMCGEIQVAKGRNISPKLRGSIVWSQVIIPSVPLSEVSHCLSVQF